MKKKCVTCEYADIKRISLHECVFYKCSTCGCIRLSTADYNRLVLKCLFELNVGKIRNCRTYSDIDRKSAKQIDKFLNYFSFEYFYVSKVKTDELCNVCRSDTVEFTNIFHRKFKIYYCSHCDSIYLFKEDFEDFLKYVEQKLKPFSLWNFIKRFFTGVKDNAKK